MNTTTAIVIGYACVFSALVFVIWRHMPRTPDAEQRRATAARKRVGLLPPPVMETAPGRNAADLDECQLILSTPYPDLDAGLARLLADIRNEQQKGD